MKKSKRLLILALVAAALCFVFAAGALAAVHGDINGDNVITAADARLTLRIAVGFDDTDEEEVYYPAAADIAEPYGVVNAADARTLLRAAVGLEDLTNAHCWGNPVYLNGIAAASCTEDMVAQYTCAVCEETETKTDPALGHDFSVALSDPTAQLVCTRCARVFPSFNGLVNVLKSDAHVYTGFSRVIESGEIVSHKIKISAAAKIAAKLAGEKLDENSILDSITSELAQNNETWFGRISAPRQITNRNFNISEKDEVSNLTAADVTSLTVENAQSVDFIDTLPDTIKFVSSNSSATFEENIADTIKAAEVGPVIKMTVTLREEKYSELKKTEGETSLQRAMSYDLRELAEEFNQKEEEDGMLFEMRCNEATSSCKVTYYFDAKTLLPVAAVYDLGIDCDQAVTIDMSVAGVKFVSGNLRFNIRNGNTEYFFFDSLFE